MSTNTAFAVPNVAVSPLPKMRKERLYTLEEYLKREEKSEKKHYFLNGKIIEMAGGTPEHAFVAVNIAHEILKALEKNGLEDKYQVGNSDIKIWIPSRSSVLYPDAVVICEPSLYLEEDDTMLLNPLVVVEVLSPSTRKYDMSNKFTLYKSVPSLMEYILVEPKRPSVTSYFRKESNLWEVRSVEKLEEKLSLPSIGIEIPLTGIYKKIKFKEQ